MSTRPSLTPLADLGRSARQAPLHGLHAPGIAAAGDDAEIGACRSERLVVDVGLGGLLLDLGHPLGGERVLEKSLRTLATPEPIKDWSLTSLKQKLIKIGAKVVSHGR